MSVASEATAKKRLPEPVTAVPGRGHPVNAPHPEHGQCHNTPHAPPDIGLYEWTARIECKKFELCSSYSVLIFLGDVPDDPDEWQVISPNYAGSHYALVGSSAAEGSESCRKEAEVVIEGFVHLNQAIVPHSGSLKPDGVVPYLTRRLH